MKNLTWQNPEQLFVAQVLIKKVKLKCCGIKVKVKSSAMKILRTKGDVDIRYVAFFMSITKLVGDTHKRYWISEYSKLCIPLPPLEEQRRIVAEISKINEQLDLLVADTL